MGGLTGGIVGLNQGTVQYCYSTGNIDGLINVGGVAGNNFFFSAVNNLQNCVAPNKEIKERSQVAYVGRIAGADADNTLNNNYARFDMTITSKGVDVPVTPSATGIHGENISVAHYGVQNWWTTAGNWHNNVAWDFTAIWQWGTNNLPILRGFPAETQNHTVN